MKEVTKNNYSYPVYCAWCLPNLTLVGWSPVQNSHGICKFCKDDVFKRELKRSDDATSLDA